MTRIGLSNPSRICLAATTALLLAAVPAHATLVTLEFGGRADFSSEGGPALNFLNGSITWDSDALPFDSDSTSAEYDLVSYTLSFNDVDVSAPVIGGGVGSSIVIRDDEVFGADPGELHDGIKLFLSFKLPFNLASTGDNEVHLLVEILGPITMFTGTGLPGDLEFENDVTLAVPYFFVPRAGDIDFPIDVPGDFAFLTREGTVPEPTAFTLTALALAGAATRVRRMRQNRS